jgi:hypothetical protein
MSTRKSREPGSPFEDTPDEAATSAPDTRPAGASAAQPHDTFFREIFSDPAQAAAVLRTILPPRVVAHIDWDTPFEAVHASMVTRDLEQLHGDLLYKIKLVDGRGAFVWVLFEHQSSVQRWMPLRLSRMLQSFLDNWHRRSPGARYLPAILPVVLHHGPRPWRAPTSLLELTDLSEQQRADFAPHLLSLDFVLDDLRTVPDEDIDARPAGPLARLVLGVMKHARSPELLAFYLAHADDIRALLATESGRFGLIMVIRYTEELNPHLDPATLIRHLAPVVGPELEHAMHPYERFLRNEARNEVLEKAVNTGVEKGQRELVLRLLTRRFGALPDAIASRVARASRSELERWSDRILDAASLDDVFASS